MKVCRWFGSLLVLVGVVALVGPRLSPVLAQGKNETWEWKAFDKDVKEGRDKDGSWYQTLDTVTNQTMKVQGMDVIQNQKQTFYIKWTPQTAEKGKWVVKQRIEGVKMSIDIGGNKIEYDSTVPQPNNPMTDFFKALQKLDLTFTVNQKDMSIEKIGGNEEFIGELGKTNPQMKPLLESILSKEALIKMAEPTLYAFPPGGDVKKGKGKWDKTSDLKLGPIGQYTTKYEFQYEGKDGKNKDLDKIKVTASMEYTPPTEGGTLPFKILKEGSSLKSKEGTGEALFNTKLGRFDSYSMKMKLEGKLKIDIGGMVTDVELSQDQTATVKSSSERPKELEKKAK
jgi:hypothetical protein